MGAAAISSVLIFERDVPEGRDLSQLVMELHARTCTRIMRLEAMPPLVGAASLLYFAAHSLLHFFLPFSYSQLRLLGDGQMHVWKGKGSRERRSALVLSWSN